MDYFDLNIKRALFVYRLGLKNATIANLARILKYVFKVKIMRSKCPGALILGLTYRCQRNCPYCSIGRYPILKDEELTAPEIKTLINQAAHIGIPKVNFFGGEPLLREDLPELVRHAVEKGLLAFLDTNGCLLTKERVGLLKKAGISCININLSSWLKQGDSEDNYISRMSEDIDFHIKHSLETKVPCVGSFYVDKALIKNGALKKLIILCRNKGFTGVRLLLPMHCGKLMHKDDNFSPDELREVFSLVDNSFVYHESILYGEGNGKRICEASKGHTIYVSPYGDVQFCYTVPFSFGNIRKSPLKDIIHRMYTHELFRSAPANECAMNDLEFRGLCNKLRLGSDEESIQYLYL